MAHRQLLVLVLSGYVIALLPALWARSDMGRIPGSIWRYAAAPRPRELWRTALVVGYVCGGWPGLLVAIGWRCSRDRSILLEEWAHLHRRNVESEHRIRPAAPPITAGSDREIVLTDYEDDEPTPAPSREDSPPAPG